MGEFNFSVVMAAYNSDLWIFNTINSLINQSLDFEKNIQIIIVNEEVQTIPVIFAKNLKPNILKILNILKMKKI